MLVLRRLGVPLSASPGSFLRCAYRRYSSSAPIEVEQKFLLRKQDIELIKKTATFVGEKKYYDEYYDTPKYALTTKDVWLRKRNGYWECKIAVEGSGSTDYYLELTNERDILLKR